MTRPGLFPVRLPPVLGLLVVCLGTLTVPFDTAVNVAFPAIVHAFGLPIPAIQWVVICYTLTYAALMLVCGRVGDIIGYRRIFLLGCAWSFVAYLLCAGAPGFAWLLVARVLQGIGAALVLSCGAALVTGLYPEAHRTRVLGFYTMMFGLGGALGPMLAGVFVAEWGWPSVFWARAPIVLLALLAGLALPRDPVVTQRQRFDGAGALLLVVAISALLLTLNRVQGIGQHAAAVVVAGVLSVAAAAGFVRRELRTPQPIVELRYFRDLDFALANGAQTALNITGFAVFLLIPFYLNRFSGLPVTLQGLTLASANVGVVLAAPVAGRLASAVAPRRLAVLGALALAAGQWVIGSTGAHPLLPLLAAAMFVQGAGVGLFQVAYFDIATMTLPRQDRGVAGSLVMMTRTVGVVTGATVLMLIFQALSGSAARSGAPVDAAFLAGFQAAFRFAAAIPMLMAVLMLLRGWGRAESPSPGV